MEKRRPNIRFRQSDTSTTPPTNLADFLNLHARIIVATTTPYKVDRAIGFLQRYGIQPDQVERISASGEHNEWVHPEEIARDKVAKVYNRAGNDLSCLVLGTDCVTEVEREAAPLGKIGGDEQIIVDRLRKIIGPNHIGMGNASILVGIAAYSSLINRGVYTVTRYPFDFYRFTDKEVQDYIRDQKQGIPHWSAGLDFADSLSKNIISIRHITKASPQFPQIFKDFQNAAFGFPENQVDRLLQQLPSQRGRKDWQLVHVDKNR